jgi:hypothetical protein
VANSGKNDSKEIIKFCGRSYKAKVHTDGPTQYRTLTFHITTGTDTNLMNKIIADIAQAIISNKMNQLGLQY